MRQMLPPTLFLICVAAALLLHFLLPLAVIIPQPLNLIGLLPLVIGAALAYAGSNQFSKVGTNIDTFNEPGTLVTDGLFRYSRNPMYLGGVLALTGIWLLLGTLSPLLVVLVLIVIADRWYITFEEAALVRKFGKSYEDYRMKTRRWI